MIISIAKKCITCEYIGYEYGTDSLYGGRCKLNNRKFTQQECCFDKYKLDEQDILLDMPIWCPLKKEEKEGQESKTALLLEKWLNEEGDYDKKVWKELKGDNMTGKEIADAVNEIIKNLDHHSEQLKNQAVNWASVRCNLVQECTELYPEKGDKSIEVYIDECDPEAWRFKEAVYNAFKEKYGFEIVIISEW